MARRSRSPTHLSLLALLFLLALLVGVSQAQGPGGQNQGGPGQGGQGQGAQNTGLPNLATVTGNQNSASKATKTPDKSTPGTQNTKAATASTGNAQSDSNPTGLPQLSTSGSPQSKATDLPALTSAGFSHPAGLPTLSQFLIPSAIVPDTSNAPFMQKSNLPEGTVFIAVGATLGFLALCVILWRLMIAYSLQQSVKRAAYAYPDEKAGFRPQAPSGYNSAFQSGYHSANLSLESLTGVKTGYDGPNHRRNKASNSRKTSAQNAAPKSSSLFFSPTAGVGSGVHTARTSTYLPAGYYASGASAPAAGNPMAHLGGPPAAGYTRMDSMSSSPPVSPGLRRGDGRDGERDSMFSPPTQGGRRTTGGLAPSSSMETFGGRAPSQHLDDMLEHHGNAMLR